VSEISIQKVSINDIFDLQRIGKQTFYETFSSANSENNMTNYLEESFSIDKLTSELNDDHSAFYFAKQDQNVIGYLKINFDQSQTEIKDSKDLEIERIYVLKAFHGKNVG